MKNLQIAKKTRLIILIFTIVLISVIGIIYYRTTFFNVEQNTVCYSGSNGIFSISFTRFTDYKTFMEAKSPDIIMYNSEEEMTARPGNGFIAGEIKIQKKGDPLMYSGDEFKKCEIELMRKSGWNTSDLTMQMENREGGFITMPFTALDGDDSGKNIYKEAVLKFGEGKYTFPISLDRQ